MKVYIIKTTFIATVKGIRQDVDEDCMTILHTDLEEACDAMKSLAIKHMENSGYIINYHDDTTIMLGRKSHEVDAIYEIMIEIVEKEI